MPLRDIDPIGAIELQRCTQYMLEILGMEYNVENTAQLEIMLEALTIYDERSRMYGDQWKGSGAEDNLGNALRKVKRQRHQLGGNLEVSALRKGGDDDAIDAVNYLVFFIRNLRAGNVSGFEED